MAPTNNWQVGALYPPGGLNNIKWTQPGGVGTPVYPQPVTGVDYFSTKPFNEKSGVFTAGCGHWMNMPLIQREYDYTTNSSVALILCPTCGYCQSAIEPFEAAFNTVLIPQLVI